MKVLVLAPAAYDTSPSQRFRIEQWARHLEPLGIEFSFVPFEDRSLHRTLYQPGRYAWKAALMSRAILKRFGTLGQVRKFDVVLVAREASLIGPAVIERLIRWLGVPLVYDFDDPLWIPYRSPRNHVFSRLKCFGKTRGLCRMASQVIAGNRLLADWARAFNANVHIVPSTIDLDRYPAAERPEGRSPVTLGWTGSHSTLPFLERLHGPLARLSETRSFRLMVISHTDAYQIPAASYEVISLRWSAEREARDLQTFDIGLAPFPNTGWTPWRCHGKVLQYMASAACVVASPIGILPDMIVPGENGFLADCDEQWVSVLAKLIDNEPLRLTVGHRGRRFVEESFASEEWALAVKHILQAAAQTRRRPVSPRIVHNGADEFRVSKSEILSSKPRNKSEIGDLKSQIESQN